MKNDRDENEFEEQPQSDQESGEMLGGDEGLVVASGKAPISRGTLVMFAVLLLGGAGLFFMHRQTGPRAAGAAVAKESAQAKQTISSFLSGGDASIRSMEKLLRNTEKVVQQFLAYPSMTQIPLKELRTNPFRQHEEKKEGMSDAGEKKKREEERLAILKAVQGLELQSIMCSDTRKACMVNNTLYREGQSIDNFSIEKISPAAVVVKNGPYRFELKIQR